MTLGEAIGHLNPTEVIGCACSGPAPVCYCAQATQHALVLVRAAHIVVKLLAAATDPE